MADQEGQGAPEGGGHSGAQSQKDGGGRGGCRLRPGRPSRDPKHVVLFAELSDFGKMSNSRMDGDSCQMDANWAFRTNQEVFPQEMFKM